MRKLALKLDDLRIESFETTSGSAGNGTVFGEQCTCYTDCTCPGCPTCGDSCGCGGETDLRTFDGAYTCDNSCGGHTCDYTCQGFMTYGRGMDCLICL